MYFNSPFERQLSRVVSRDLLCKQTAKVRTFKQIGHTTHSEMARRADMKCQFFLCGTLK